MWSQILLCLLVGLAYADRSTNPAWKDNTEYVYEVRGRSLASLHEVGNEYSGILLKSKLTVRPKPDGLLQAQISQPQYAQIHAPLEKGWETIIPDSQLNYQPLKMSQKPFEIVMKNGAVRDLIVSKEVSNWEANIIKSIVSQFQLDTQGENLITSHFNTNPQDGSNTAVFKTLEETVTGVSETLYEIHPLPEYVLQSKPWLAPESSLRADGQIIEIVKSKNFSRSEERPSYHFGFDNMPFSEPTSNKIGNFFTRTSVSRAVVTGNLNRHTVQSSITIDQILIRPTLNDKQEGSVNTMLNVTLISVQSRSQQFEELSNPVALGSLVYRYDLPFANSNEARSGKQYTHLPSQASSEEDLSSERQSSESLRNKRSIRDDNTNALYSGFNYVSDNSESSEEEYWQQEQPRLAQAPESPLLPFTVGYQGKSIKDKRNIAEIARKLAQEIGQDTQRPDEIPEKNTVGKFVLLSSILRVMNQNDMQQVASQLYSKDKHGPQGASWIAFRDAVAQSGTGPALLTIQDWIKNKKIETEEAAEVVSTAAHAARQPTEEYMRSFYQMVHTPEVMQQPHLNQSALLSYCKLVHQVYVNKVESHNNYPVHSFGSFRTRSGKQFLKKEVIPHLTQKLHEAIAAADTQKIHIYIRALGNVGHPQILEAFEPYLEGKKQASQFQRVLMVIALEKMVRSHPKIAQSVLYKIYQNPSDEEQVRVAAVYQLMRTNPSADMLQRMASYTNTDLSEYVNSAVKSSIENAAELNGYEHEQLRSSAQSAKHLLTKKRYGAQYSKNHLRSYVVEEMKTAYKQTTQIFGGQDDTLAKGVKYALRTRFGGIRQEVVNMQALVSSIEDLTEVFEKQTQRYQEKKQQKKSQAPHTWSSENIAKLLNMQTEQREQLEGNWHLEMGPLQKIFSFDNQTIERMPEILRQVEESLRNGKHFHHNKMIIPEEMAIAFPTGMGLPFIYTYDRPVLVSIEGKVRATANPQVSNGETLTKPETLEAEYEMRILVSARTQSQLGFITPFDNQRYSAGYDKNIQIHMPVSGKIEADLKTMQIKTELSTPQNEVNTHLLHFSTWPYTAKDDIFASQPNRKVISKNIPQLQKIDRVLGQKETGIALHIQITSERPLNGAWVYEKLQRHDPLSALLSPWMDENIEHSEINVKVDFEKSTTKKIVAHIGYQQKYHPSRQDESNESTQGADMSKFQQISDEPLQRQREFMKRASVDISNAQSQVMDASVEFQGQEKIKYIATVASAKSLVDPKSKVLVHVKRNEGNGKPWQFALSAKSHIPNTNGVDVTYAFKFDPTSTSQIQAFIGENFERSTKMSAQIKYRKSDERQRYLMEQPLYKECQREMQQGNKQLPACAKVAAQANLLDQVNMKIDYENLTPEVLNLTYKWYTTLGHLLYPKTQLNIVGGYGTGKDQVEVDGQFSPDLKWVNFFIRSKHASVKFENVKLNQLAKELFVPHPVFHVRSRLMGMAYKYDVYRPFCVLDKTAASTLDNRTYPVELQNEWTVLLQYVPRRPQESQQQRQQLVEEQLREQIENYVVLARSSDKIQGQKEVKIVVQTPYTQEKSVQIDLIPSGSSSSPRLLVNGEEVKYNTHQITDLFEGKLQAYGLPNEEVKIEFSRAFYVIYDGSRVKLTIVNDKFRDATRGLCGTFTGEKQTDFTSPRNCILRNPEEFVATYTILESGKDNQKISQLKSRAEQQQCFQKHVMYANVISESDAGRKSSERRQFSGSSCTKLQTQYVEENDDICFTLRPLPLCKKGCQRRGKVVKNIPVHCVQSTAATNLWKNEIKKGASPDFSGKSQTKSIRMEIPQRCEP